MNARKSAKEVTAALSRQLQGQFLKTPPPAFYPMLSHPPPPSLVRTHAARPVHDLPPTAYLHQHQSSAYEAAREKRSQGLRLTAQEQEALNNPSAAPISSSSPSSSSAPRPTRRRPPPAPNTRSDRPLPIVFPEDKIRIQFFLDHPFEAYRPVHLAEGASIAAELEPKGDAWTELSQRSLVPSAEDAIAFTHHLHCQFAVDLPTAYHTAVAQFRTLRAENETAVRAAQLESEAHGAVYFTAIHRGVDLEDKVLDRWVDAREIQARLASSSGGAGAASVGASSGPFGSSAIAGLPELSEGSSASTGEVEFTGGLNYLARYKERGQQQQA